MSRRRNPGCSHGVTGTAGRVGVTLALVGILVPAFAEVPALPVATEIAQLQPGYQSRRVFVGRVEALRQSELGFELGGRLDRVAVDDGDRVETGELLAVLDDARLAARRAELVASLEQVRADLKLAGATLARTEEAAGFNGVSRQELDEARERYNALKAAERLANSRVATVQVDMDKTRLYAPYSAVVIRRYADEGQVLAAGQPVLSLQEDGPFEIRVGVTGEGLEGLQRGQRREIDVDGRSLMTEVRAVLPIRGAGTRTVDVILGLMEDSDGLRPGDLVNLALVVDVDEAGFWLPISALTEGVRGLWAVFIAEPMSVETESESAATHMITRRTVEVLYEESDRVYVRGMLRDGNRVVTDGTQRIVPGMAVRLTKRRVAAESDKG